MSRTRTLDEVNSERIKRLEEALAALCELMQDANPHIAEHLATIADAVNSPL